MHCHPTATQHRGLTPTSTTQGCGHAPEQAGRGAAPHSEPSLQLQKTARGHERGKNRSGQGLQSVSTFFLNSLGSSLIPAGSALLHSNTPKPKETVPRRRSPVAGSPCGTKVVHPSQEHCTPKFQRAMWRKKSCTHPAPLLCLDHADGAGCCAQQKEKKDIK